MKNVYVMFIFTMYLNLESKEQWGFDFQFAIPLPNSKKNSVWRHIFLVTMHFPDWKELPRCWFLSIPPLTCYTIHRLVLAVFRDDSISILVTQSDLLTKGALLLSRACHAAAKKVIGFALQSCLCSLHSWWLHCKYFMWDGKTVYSWSSEIQIF